MAHITEQTGRKSELIAEQRLIENGYVVHEPVTREPYDLLVEDPVSGRFFKAQVKTVHIRPDRDHALVVMAKRTGGDRYSTDDVDWIIGVDGNDVYIIPHTGQSEYWATPTSAAVRWHLLPEGGSSNARVVG
ncbi:MAG: hypothetical protein IRZ03_18485 [Acidobacterium ailaaui]|nr:hypothetical protein [Pseudacidobacterium ailaaui]